MRSQTTTTSQIRSPQRWLSPEHLSAATCIGLLAVLEVLPIQAGLLVYAADAYGSLAAAFGPLWLIVATLLMFALARWRLGQRNPIWLTLAALAIGAVAIALFAALSPTAYGDTPGGLFSFAWLQRLRSEAFHDTPHFNGLFGIVALVAYLGWRGLTLGAPLPKSNVTLRRYTVSLAVVIVACLGAQMAPEVAQAPLQSVLLALLALDVFAGLAATALARAGNGRESTSSEASGAETTRWLLSALGAAALVVVGAFALALLLNLRLAHSLSVALGYVVRALSAALDWLANSVAYVLWFIFANTLGKLLPQTPPYAGAQTQGPVSVPKQQSKYHVLGPPPHELVVAVAIFIALLAVVLVLFAVYRAIRAALGARRAIAEPEVDEEREALDARGLLRGQMSDLLASLRRRPNVDADPLTSGGVRWLYREVLRTGATAGLARRDGETADEYSERLARSARERGGGELELAALTRAYDDARYGESAADASPAAAAEARAASTALARLRVEP